MEVVRAVAATVEAVLVVEMEVEGWEVAREAAERVTVAAARAAAAG